MKNTIGYVVSSIFVVFTTILVVCIISAFSTINKANAYHQTCIADIQASNFSPAVIAQYNQDNGSYETTITDRTVKNENENLEKTGRIYEVVTTYNITIPVINYEIVQTIHGYAR